MFLALSEKILTFELVKTGFNLSQSAVDNLDKTQHVEQVLDFLVWFTQEKRNYITLKCCHMQTIVANYWVIVYPRLILLKDLLIRVLMKVKQPAQISLLRFKTH